MGTLSGNNYGGNPGRVSVVPAGAGYETVSKSDGTNPFNITYDQVAGTWSFDASAWDHFAPTVVRTWSWIQVGHRQFDRMSISCSNSFRVSPVGTFLWFPLAVNGDGTGGLSHMILYATKVTGR